ncbi:hypothetical protein FCV25MIE_14822 [Fagus crenata]
MLDSGTLGTLGNMVAGVGTVTLLSGQQTGKGKAGVWFGLLGKTDALGKGSVLGWKGGGKVGMQSKPVGIGA